MSVPTPGSRARRAASTSRSATLRRVGAVAGAHDHAELLAAEPADDVVRADARRAACRRACSSSSSPTPWPCTSLTRLKSSMSSISTATGRCVRLASCSAFEQPLVEAAVVEEAGERVGLRLVLEPRADLRVVERERRGIGEALRELELGLGEDAVLADAVDVEHALDLRARDQRDRDERLGVDRRARARSGRAGRGAPGSRERPRAGCAAQPVMPSSKRSVRRA